MPDQVDELPEGDTFDRAYVEKLRAEAAKYRTALRPFEDAFGDFNDQEKSFLFGMLQSLNKNPAEGALQFRDMAKNILKDDFYADLEDIPVVEAAQDETASTEEAEGEGQVSLTQEQMQKMLDERDAKAKAEAEAAAKEAADQAEIEAVYAEIEEATGFIRGSKEFGYALSVGAAASQAGDSPDFKQIGPQVATMLGIEVSANGDDSTESSNGDSSVENAVENVVEGSGNEHAKTAGAGGSGKATETPKSVVEVAAEQGKTPMEVARDRFEARMG